jgi:hypothetical protein
MRVTDAQIQAVIDDLRKQTGGATGSWVRAELARRHGARGGVARIYRLLGQTHGEVEAGESAAVSAKVQQLQTELAAMTKRAELAEHREVAHQDWAANQIYALREKLRQHELAPRAQGVQHEQFMRAYREVIALRRKVVELESRLAARPAAPSASATS